MTQVMRYTRHNRQQLLASDMAYAIVIIYNDMMKDPQKDVMTIVDSIKQQLKIIQKELYGEKLVLKQNNLRHYNRSIDKIKLIIDKAFSEESRLSLDFIASVIVILNEKYDEIKQFSKKKTYIEAWGKLVKEMQNLYEFYDEDLTLDSCHENGATIGQSVYEFIRSL